MTSKRPYPSRHQAGSLGYALDQTAGELAAAGIEEARLDARLLVTKAAGRSLAYLLTHGEEPIAAGEEAALAALVGRRLDREPISQILGEREFWSLPFRVTADTLTPRPDTETVIEAVLDWLGERRNTEMSILDLGTGTGCLVLALLSELPRAVGTGVDISEAALAVARENSQSLGLDARCRLQPGDWVKGLTGRYDIIVSNPPYIPEGDRAGLAPEVRDHEPGTALFAGADGLDAYRSLAADGVGHLAPGGGIFLEIGAGQEDSIIPLFKNAGLAYSVTRRDLAGHVRCLGFFMESPG